MKVVPPILLMVSCLFLTACGGNPIDYDKGPISSIFVWRQDAYAEHPAVPEENAPGMPTSELKKLVGKELELVYPHGAHRHTVRILFTSSMRCDVTTDTPTWLGDGVGDMRTYRNGNYDYKITDAEGKKATLVVSFSDGWGWLRLTMNMEFQDVYTSMPTTIQSFIDSMGTNLANDTPAVSSTWRLAQGGE